MKKMYVTFTDVLYSPTIMGHAFHRTDTATHSYIRCLKCGVVVEGLPVKIRACSGEGA